MSESVSLHRDYPAPPERVFAAFTNVDLLSRWFGCGPDMLWTVHTWEPLVGGAIHVSLQFEKGPYEVRGEFLQVDHPRRLRYRFGPDHIVDVTIDPHGSGSRVTVNHSGLENSEMCGIITGGWTAGLGQLGSVLEPVGVRGA
jgi:uncharacterized protein YndB with AHSA1/START domain